MIPGIHTLLSFAERIEGSTLTMWTVPLDIGPIGSFSRRYRRRGFSSACRKDSFALYRIAYSRNDMSEVVTKKSVIQKKITYLRARVCRRVGEIFGRDYGRSIDPVKSLCHIAPCFRCYRWIATSTGSLTKTAENQRSVHRLLVVIRLNVPRRVLYWSLLPIL